MKIVVLGTTARGNGLTTPREGLVGELEARGHEVLVLQPAGRPRPERRGKARVKPNTRAYRSVAELKSRYTPRIRNADVVIVGSRVPCGADVGRWVTRVAKGVTAFYDNDTQATLTGLKTGSSAQLPPALIPKFDLYLSVGATEAVDTLQREFKSPMARALNPSDAPASRAAELERFFTEAMTGQLMA